jgi:hypothetical protein
LPTRDEILGMVTSYLAHNARNNSVASSTTSTSTISSKRLWTETLQGMSAGPGSQNPPLSSRNRCTERDIASPDCRRRHLQTPSEIVVRELVSWCARGRGTGTRPCPCGKKDVEQGFVRLRTNPAHVDIVGAANLRRCASSTMRTSSTATRERDPEAAPRRVGAAVK